MINLSNINFKYRTGSFHLIIPELSVAPGEKVAVIGPSGSGKTTLLNLVAGILKPQEGKILVDDFEVNTQNDRTRREYRISNIGFIFQDFGLIDYLDALDNIIHPYRITKSLKLDSSVKKRALLLGRQMGISSKLSRHPRDLSRGECQRVAICRALLSSPKLLLADEATGNLDPENKTLILKLLSRAVADHTATLLAVTHDHDLLHHFDRVIDFRDFLPGGQDEK